MIENWMAPNGTSILRTISHRYNVPGQITNVSDSDFSYNYTSTASGQVATVDSRVFQSQLWQAFWQCQLLRC